MSAFFLGSQTVEDVTFLKVSGTIDEDNTLASSAKKIDGKTVVIDLSGVTRINSCGVRDWVNWLNDLDARGKRVVLVRCSAVIVNQINLVHNFVGRGVVRSFFAPYYCARCDREQQRLIQTDTLSGAARVKAPAVLGEGCDVVPCQMAFDDLEDAYFAFVPRAGAVSVDDGLQRLIDGLSPSIKERIKRLDEAERVSADKAVGLGTGMYAQLTATASGLSLDLRPDRPSLTGAMPVAAPTRNHRSARGLVIAAAAVGLAIAGYLAFYVFGA